MGWMIMNTETGEPWSSVKFGTEESAVKHARWLNENEDSDG